MPVYAFIRTYKKHFPFYILTQKTLYFNSYRDKKSLRDKILSPTWVAFCFHSGYNDCMKTFKYKFSKVQKILISLGLVLSVAGFAVNLTYCIMNGIETAADPVYPIMQYVLMFIVTVGLFVLLVSLLLNSAYVISDKQFKTKFGIIVSKYDVAKIETVVLDRKTDKLSVTFDNGEFIVIVVKQDWYNDFIEALLAANPKIEYTINSIENGDTDKKA